MDTSKVLPMRNNIRLTQLLVLLMFIFYTPIVWAVKKNTEKEMSKSENTILENNKPDGKMSAFGNAAASISNFPHIESFESGIGLWTQSTNDDFNWTRDSGGTGSSGTGPNTGANGSFYMYTETSSPRSAGDEAHLQASYNFSNLSNPELKFYYHMYGSSMGALYVDVYDGSWHNVWSKVGQQHTSNAAAYTQAIINLKAFENKSNIIIRFRGIRGSSYRGDMAIDYVEVSGSAASSAPNCATLTSPSNGATNVSTSPTLSWNSSTGATSYKLYFGTNYPPSNMNNGTNIGNVTTYQVSSLNNDQKYYWKIVPRNSSGDAMGCLVRNFTTEADQSGGGSTVWSQSGSTVYYNSGSVGIGTSNPGSYKLAVKGKIRAEEVIVETGWADYVFEKDYDLKTLGEVEQYINTHGHLPGIPSEKEVKGKGVSLGEINAKLLEKIEELTLHVIQQQKEIDKLKQALDKH